MEINKYQRSFMRNCPYGFDIYLVNVKTMRTIAQIFVAFSEKLNFIWAHYFLGFLLGNANSSLLKFIYSEKATKFWKIFPLHDPVRFIQGFCYFKRGRQWKVLHKTYRIFYSGHYSNELKRSRQVQSMPRKVAQLKKFDLVV